MNEHIYVDLTKLLKIIIQTKQRGDQQQRNG